MTERRTLAGACDDQAAVCKGVGEIVAGIPDKLITDWRTNPRYCRGLAFLRAHAVMLLAHRLLPTA